MSLLSLNVQNKTTIPDLTAKNTVHDIPPPPVNECCLVKWFKSKKHKRQITRWEIDYVIHVRARSSLNEKTKS